MEIKSIYSVLNLKNPNDMNNENKEFTIGFAVDQISKLTKELNEELSKIELYSSENDNIIQRCEDKANKIIDKISSLKKFIN